MDSEWKVLRVKLERSEKGTGLFRVSFEDRQLEYLFSYSPADTISELAEAVDAIVADPGSRTVVFHGGPDELELTFLRTEASDGVRLRLTTFPSHSREGRGDEVLDLRTTANFNQHHPR